MRYLPHTPSEIEAMLAAIGLDSPADLFAPIPEHLRLDRALNVPPALGEMELDAQITSLAQQSPVGRRTPSFLGAGLYEHYVPHVVNQLILRGELLTAYTPYQPEISQGTLKILFEYQSMMASLLGLDVANASMYDGATGAAEAALMALRLTRRSGVLCSGSVHPEYQHVMHTLLANTAELTVMEPTDDGLIDLEALARELEADSDLGAVVIQSPNFFGLIEPMAQVARRCEAAGALLIVTFNEPLAWGILRPPGECGAAIAAGEAISMGSSIGLGGPSLGVFAAQKAHVRQMPGRLAGLTADAQGREGYVLTLSTREQHIRRERATSNICTNQGLCATAATIYLALLGKTGLAELARLNLAKAEHAKRTLTAIPGVGLRFSGPTFNEFTLTLPTAADSVVAACAEQGLLAGVPLSRYYPERRNELLVAVTEMNRRTDIDRLAETLRAAL